MQKWRPAVKPMQNADDTTIMIKRTEENLRNLVRIIQYFAKISDKHANLGKTHIMPQKTNSVEI